MVVAMSAVVGYVYVQLSPVSEDNPRLRFIDHLATDELVLMQGRPSP